MDEQPSENDAVDQFHEEGSHQSGSPNHFSSTGMAVQNENEVLSIHDAARQAGVSRAAVLSWVRNGFIEAQTSKQGWTVRAGDVETAQVSANEDRMGLQYSREDRLDPHVHQADSERVVETASFLVPRAGLRQASDRQLDNTLFAPLAEFVRDQADVVQEQAETIGFLQAELRRTREQLQAREGDETPVNESEVASQPENESEAVTSSGHGFVIEGLKDQFARAQSNSDEAQPADDRSMLFDVINQDPFSDEAARARMAIEESERRISNMWDEHEERRMRHSAEPERSAEKHSLLKWFPSPMKRRSS